MQHSRILIVDDDRTFRKTTSEMLCTLPVAIEEAEGGEAALARLTDPAKPLVDLVLLDLTMPQMDGRETLARIRVAFPALPVLILTGSEALSDVVALMRAGATDYITKPASAQRLCLSVSQHLTLQSLAGEVARLTRRESGAVRFDDLIGANEGLAAAVAVARKAAASDIPVLITGASGTGKELLARAIHGESHRAGRPFVAINCGAIPENLVESTLFGHEKGAFTGAIAREAGKFREAGGGTLLLDEVGELSLTAQTRLLRALQQKEVQPVGGAKPVKVDVRILSATHRNLGSDVKAGRFREDLYYRLSVLPIAMPPLAGRGSDIRSLARFLLARFCTLERKALRLSEDALLWLERQDWPGNVRELENLLYRSVVLADKETFTAEDFIALTGSAQAPYADGGSYVTLLHGDGRAKSWDDIEAEIINATLKRCAGNIPLAARMLGMGQSTLYKKLSDRHKAA